jgi:hypothetical protein
VFITVFTRAHYLAPFKTQGVGISLLKENPISITDALFFGLHCVGEFVFFFSLYELGRVVSSICEITSDTV